MDHVQISRWHEIRNGTVFSNQFQYIFGPGLTVEWVLCQLLWVVKHIFEAHIIW